MSDLNFSISIIKENEDGSADYQINLDESDKNNVVRWAIIEMLKRAIEEGKKLDPSQYNMENT